MIKRFAQAQMLHGAFMRAQADINDALARIWDSLSDEEKSENRSKVGLILGEMYLEGIRPLERKHPTLTPDDRKDDYA